MYLSLEALPYPRFFEGYIRVELSLEEFLIQAALKNVLHFISQLKHYLMQVFLKVNHNASST